MSRVVEAARLWIGTPYLHGASARGIGCDCLGLVRGLWRELDGSEPEAVPPYSVDWAETAGGERLIQAVRRHLREVTEEAEGQLIVFRMRRGGAGKHLAIQTGIGAAAGFVHAYSGHGVVESALTEPWRRRIAARFDLEERIGGTWPR